MNYLRQVILFVLLGDLKTTHRIVTPVYNQQPRLWSPALPLPAGSDTRDSVWPFLSKRAQPYFTALVSLLGRQREAGGHREAAPGAKKSRA